jgi:hypothetical protein
MQWWWLGQRDPVVRLTKWLVIWTALLFVGTTISAIILKITDSTLRETLEANNRAWVAVITARLDNIPEAGLPISGALTYKNIGPSPALNTNYVMFLQRLPILDKNLGVKSPHDDVCSAVPDGNLTIFPGYEFGTAFPSSAETIATSAVIKGDEILYWRGCFVYETYQKIRHTQFCYYLRHGEPRWYWQNCGTDAN